jgi:hypothetical protein
MPLQRGSVWCSITVSRATLKWRKRRAPIARRLFLNCIVPAKARNYEQGSAIGECFGIL